MKPDYIKSFPRERYSSSNILTDTNLQDIVNLLGGLDEAKLFALKMEDNLDKSQRELLANKNNALLNYGECRARIEEILRAAKSLNKSFADIPIRRPKAFAENDWKTNSLITKHLEKPPHMQFKKDEFSLWTIREGVKSLISASECSLEKIRGKKNLVEHPIHYFCKQAISCYIAFFKKNPVIQRDSLFVQAVTIMVDSAELMPTNKKLNIYSLLHKAKETDGINSQGFHTKD